MSARSGLTEKVVEKRKIPTILPLRYFQGETRKRTLLCRRAIKARFRTVRRCAADTSKTTSFSTNTATNCEAAIRQHDINLCASQNYHAKAGMSDYGEDVRTSKPSIKEALLSTTTTFFCGAGRFSTVNFANNSFI